MPGGQADEAVQYSVATGAPGNFRTLIRTLAAQTARGLLLHLGQHNAGNLSRDELAVAGGTLLLTANEHAATLADIYVASMLRAQPLGLASPIADADRLHDVILTAADPDSGTNPADALSRLGTSEPSRSAQRTTTEALRGHGARGWRRAAGGGRVCPVCAAMANGEVLPATAEMYTHPGCSCVAVPVAD